MWNMLNTCKMVWKYQTIDYRVWIIICKKVSYFTLQTMKGLGILMCELTNKLDLSL